MSQSQSQSTTETAKPEQSVLSRVASIPLVSSSLSSIHLTLSTNPYTKYSYTTAQGISTSAYKMSEPIQQRLAPLIVRADSFANMAYDAVESRYPYPFQAKPEEIVDYVRQRRVSAYEAATKTLDERVKTPAYNVGKGIDQKFAPIVDYFEGAVDRLQVDKGEGPSTRPSETQEEFQYQRVLALSNRLKDQIYVYSNEQMNHLQNQNSIIQRGTETAHNISSLASSSITGAQQRISHLSDAMISELSKLQASTAASAQHLQSQALSHIPAGIQQSYVDVTASLGHTITEFRQIAMDREMPVQEKVSKIVKQVREGIEPILGMVSEILARKKEHVEPPPEGTTDAPVQ